MVTYDAEAAARLRTAAPLTRPPSAPAAVAIANVLIAGYGLLATASGFFGAIAHVAAGKASMSAGLGGAPWLFEHFLVWATIQIALGVLTILCGLGIWRRYRWSRSGGQIVMASWAVLSLAVGIAMAATVTGPSPQPAMLTGYLAMWRATALVTSAAWAFALLAPAWLLHRRDARDWFDIRPVPDGTAPR